MTLLAGDIGGTNTRLQLVEPRGEGCKPAILAAQTFPSQQYPDLHTPVRNFLRQHGTPGVSAACLAVAGPVQTDGAHQHAVLTNLPWQMHSNDLAKELNIPRLRLINDFQATAYGIAGLEAADTETLQPGTVQTTAPRLVLGAGTGLGVCQLIWQGNFYEAIPGEGGHLAFAPTDELEDELLRFLRLELGRVSYERLLSGAGLTAIYRFLLHREGVTDDPLLSDADPAATISRTGLGDTRTRASHALDLFCTIYGALAGDLALVNLPFGGVYIAGGIAPRLIERLRQGRFLGAFHAKGRMQTLTENMPLHVVMNTDTGLLGAALAAGRL